MTIPIRTAFAESTPPSIMAGLKAWYADQATLAGSLVSSWTDLSGNGFHATGSSAKPTWVQNAQNGKPVVRFAGAQNLASAYGSTIAQPSTYLLVAKCSGVGTNEVLFDGLDGTHRNLCYRNTAPTIAAFGGVGQISATPTTIGAMNTYLLVFNGATLSKIRVNGGAQAATGDASNQGVAGLSIGSVGGASFFNGDIAALVHWAHAPTAGEITAAEAWARSAYGTW